MEFWTNGNQRMTITNSGSVGINQTTPSAVLHVDGSVRFESLPTSLTNSQYLSINPAGLLQVRNGVGVSPGTTPGNVLYWDGADWTEVPFPLVHVDPGANFVGINTTSVVGPSALNYMGPPTGTPLPTGWLAPGPIIINDRFSVDGDVSISGNYYGENIYIASDERIKRDISNLPEWKRILDLQPYTYKYIGQEHEGMSYGFLAQDVNKVLPELTSLWGKIGSVNYIGFIPFLSQGLREHEERLNNLESALDSDDKVQKHVEKLEVENQDLKTQNQLLKERIEAIEQKFESICQLPCMQELKDIKSKETIKGNTLKLNDKAELYQNEPNPFTSNTLIRYYLPDGSENSKIVVRNTEGKLVGEFLIEKSGNGSITIESGKLAPSTYYYSLHINGAEVESKKMVLLK